MKVNEIIDAEKQRVDAMNNVAYSAKKQAKVAAANLKIKKAKVQI